jgi:pSer/pThr/pTyr-binding forkhead associated (FHA) protein
MDWRRSSGYSSAWKIVSSGNNTHDTGPELLDATDDALDASDTVVPILPGRVSRRAWLEFKGRRVVLRPGSIMIGRSGSCQIILEDTLVSRRHALIVVKTDAVKVKDLDSANGIYVNGTRIEESVTLNPGDRIVIGQEEMVFRTGSLGGDGATEQSRVLSETLHGTEPGTLPRPVEEESEATQQGQALELLGGVADKVLALGRGDEAERILATCLTSMLLRARDSGAMAEDVAEMAVTYAMKLAIATGKARWADYTFELYTTLRRPLPSAVVDQLYKSLRNLPGINLSVLRAYVAALRAAQGRFGPTERFLAHRIEGLERLLK